MIVKTSRGLIRIFQFSFFISRFQLLQIVKKYGGIKNFNFMFHMNGPLKGEPRGYCFVEYETKEVCLY